MKVLVIGSGGREHAITWKLAQSDLIEKIFVAPGNAGTHRELKSENINIDPLNFEELSNFVKNQGIDFTIVGPEVPLVAGIIDYFHEKEQLILGPSKQAAQLEGSKLFAKQFMQKYSIPTAKFNSFTDIDAAKDYLEQQTLPVVIKADGLAAGKGVIVAHDVATANAAIEDMLQNKRFGEASNQIIIEEFIKGEELSFIVLCDGHNFIPFASSQDHKARDNGDVGPNTGGMGAYSPAPIVEPDLYAKIISTIVQPTIEGMNAEGSQFCGFLYAGLMITPEGEVKVLEYNCRFGDPEAQPILMRLDSDFATLCLAALNGQLDNLAVKWSPKTALGVVLTAKGYPGKYNTNEPLTKLNELSPSNQYKVFHAGTTIKDGKIVTNGGRVMCATVLADNLGNAQKQAYDLVNKIKWEGCYYRTDIGHKALTKVNN